MEKSAALIVFDGFSSWSYGRSNSTKTIIALEHLIALVNLLFAVQPYLSPGGGFCRRPSFMAPPWGLSTPRAPKELFQKIRKSNMVTKQMFFLRISPYFACAKL